jgi:hypothetical protein
VADPESVLFVDHEQPEALEDHVLRQQAMGTDHHVDGADVQARDHRLLLLGTPEARQQLDTCWERSEALGEGVEVLLRQHRGRHQHGHLTTVGDRLERRPQRHLGLAVSDVARHQAIHGPLVVHVPLGVLDGAHLVRRFLEAERCLEFALPWRVPLKRRPLRNGACRVETQEFLGHLPQGSPHRFLDALPCRPAEPIEPSRAVGRSHVLGDEIEALDREVEPAAIGILEEQEIGAPALRLERPQPVVAANAVVLVHDQVVGQEIRERRDDRAPLERRSSEPSALGAEDLVLGQQDKAEGRNLEARATLADQHTEPVGAPESHLRPGFDLVLR